MLIADHTATIEACRFCFMCRHVCTLGVVTGRESDTPRGKGLILFKTLRGHVDWEPDLVETLYRCCLCGMCQTWCKAACSPPDAGLAARADVVAAGREPDQVRQIKDNLLETGNPFGLPAEERFRAFGEPDLFRAQAEVLYYVGCDTAYLQPEIAQTTVRVLRAAGVPFSLLRQERSTGKPLWLLGYRDEARAMARELAAQIRATQCRTLVTGCPSSYDVFRRDFPAMGLDLGPIEVLHTAQYLDRLGQEGRLTPRRATVSSATLLDGTYLGRTHKLFEEPRRVLGRLPGLTLREMAWSRELACACGEPGGVFRLLQPGLSRQLAARVLAEAAHSGAEVLVTTCPATKTALAEADGGPQVLDLAEVVAQALG